VTHSSKAAVLFIAPPQSYFDGFLLRYLIARGAVFAAV
jgi:hypothetical protein